MSVAIDAPITIPQRGDGNRSRSVGARQRLAPDQHLQVRTQGEAAPRPYEEFAMYVPFNPYRRCTQNWYMPAKVVGCCASNASQAFRSVIAESCGKRER